MRQAQSDEGRSGGGGARPCARSANRVSPSRGRAAVRPYLWSLLAATAVLAAEPVPPPAPPFTPGPVIEWAKPMAGPSPRVVCLLQGAKEEGLELLRRFSFEGEVLAGKGGKYGVDSTASSLARRRLKQGDVDVFVVGGIYWKKIPATLRLAILEGVQRGLGLLVVQAPASMMDTTLPKVLTAAPAPEAAAAITRGIPIGLLPLVTISPERNSYCVYPDADHPAPTPEQLVTAARFGQGRIAVLNYSVAESNVVYLYSLTPGLRLPAAPFVKPYPYWEYCHALLGRAVLWCAAREPKLALSAEARAAGPVAVVTVTGQPSSEPVALEAVVRDRYHTVRGTARTTLKANAPLPAQWSVALPGRQLPPGGLCFVNVWARRGGKVVDWTTATTDRAAPASIGEVTLDARRYERERPVRASVGAAGDLTGLTLRAELTGTDGRVLQRWTGPARASTTVELSLLAAQTLVSTLDVELVAGDRVVACERRPVFLAPGAPREFFAYSWMDAEAYYTRDYLRRIRDQGVDAVLAGGGAATYWFQSGRLAGEENLRLVPTNVADSRLGTAPDGDPAKLPRPLTDPKIMAEEQRRVRACLPLVADAQPLGYSLMDEWVLGTNQRPTDYGDSALTAFRQWVRQVYPTVAALNESWGTAFGDWDQVMPKQVKELPAGDDPRLNLASFVDYRRFLDTVGPTAFGALAETIREADAGARVGLCGTEGNSTWFGHDWFQLLASLDFICGYGDAAAVPNISREMRGLQRELQRSYRRPGSLLSCWVGYHNTPFYRDQALKLLLHDFDGIAYFAGNPSIYADFPYLDYDFTLSDRARLAGAGTTELRRGLDRLVWSSRRDHCGIGIVISQPSLHVASAQRLEGAWGSAVVALAQAVEDAGLQYDLLDPAQLTSGVVGERGYRVLLLPRVTCLAEAERRAVSAFAAGGGRVWYDTPPGDRNEHGKPRADGPLTAGLTALPAWPKERRDRAELLARALAIPPPVKVDCQAEVYLPTECIRYQLGPTELVSVQTDVLYDGRQPNPEATLTFPDDRHVYDVREGAYLGRTRTVRAALDPWHILLYARLPYQVTGLRVEPPATVPAGGAAEVRVQVQADGAPGPHFVRLTATAPDGRERSGFAQTIRAESGRDTATLRFALNDPPGRWRLSARDAATGVTGQAEVTLGRPE